MLRESACATMIGVAVECDRWIIQAFLTASKDAIFSLRLQMDFVEAEQLEGI